MTTRSDSPGGFSIEVVPPARGAGLEELFGALEAIMPHRPSFVSVTDHPGGSAWADGAGGPRRVALRGKPGTLGTAVALERAFGVATVPHLVAAEADRFATEDLLIDLHYAGFRDLFVVRGDARFSPGGGSVQAPAEGYASARDLVAHIAALNRGEYLPPAGSGRPTAFRVGVAGYPNKHFASPNLAADLRSLKAKVEAGASFVVTQMVFDAREYADFVARLRAEGVDVPVIPGIKPLTRAAQAASVPAAFHVDVPEPLLRALEDAPTPEAARLAGVAWTARLAEELLALGAPSLHFFTMGKGAATRAVLDAVYGTPR